MSAPTSRPSAPSGHRPTASSSGESGRTAAFDRSSYGTALNRGYGETMGRGIELALTLVIVGGFGWLLDRVFGTYPTLTIILSLAGFAGITAKLWLGYDLEMRKIDHEGVWHRPDVVDPLDGDSPDTESAQP